MSNDLNDLPRTNDEIVELAKYTRDRAPDRKLPDQANLFVSYLLEHGFGRLRVRNVLMPVWPEAAELIKVGGGDACRLLMGIMEGRNGYLEMLEDMAKKGLLHENDVQPLLEEWDALHFPNQLPAPVRERALKRHRFAIGESDDHG
jgi:hypothetical protein